MRLSHMPALKRKKAISFVWSLLAFFFFFPPGAQVFDDTWPKVLPKINVDLSFLRPQEAQRFILRAHLLP